MVSEFAPECKNFLQKMPLERVRPRREVRKGAVPACGDGRVSAYSCSTGFG